MTAFYNEHDRYAAQYLRNLMAAGLIAPGVVDERDIQEIEPWELLGYTQVHMFAGIGIWSGALRAAGWPDDEPIWTGSCPCQPFSNAGQKKGFPMTATFGPLGAVSSRSATLQELLASRLRRKTEEYGSILYRLTWKHWDLPSGRRICALRASGARISVKGIILSGWPTATTRDWKDGQECLNVEINCLLGREVWMAGWPSPTVGNATGSQIPKNASPTGRREDGSKATVALPMIAVLAGWPTATTMDANRGSLESRPHDKGIPLTQRVPLAGWATPRTVTGGAESAARKQELGRTTSGGGDLQAQTQETQILHYAIRGRLCRDTGMMLIGPCAETLPENQAGGPLSPEHSRWLMGLPIEWANCAPTGMRSISKRQKVSAKSSSKSALVFDL